MQSTLLYAAGGLAIAIAIVHGSIGELRLLPNAKIEPTVTRDILHVVFRASSVDWFCYGALLLLTPSFGSRTAQLAVVAASAVVFGYATYGNYTATQGRHFGWMLLALLVGLLLSSLVVIARSGA